MRGVIMLSILSSRAVRVEGVQKMPLSTSHASPSLNSIIRNNFQKNRPHHTVHPQKLERLCSKNHPN